MILGLVLPVLAILGCLYLLFNGQIRFSVRDCLTPLILIFGLLAIYSDGEYRSKNKK